MVIDEDALLYFALFDFFACSRAFDPLVENKSSSLLR
jgi:hypothetical protein